MSCLRVPCTDGKWHLHVARAKGDMLLPVRCCPDKTGFRLPSWLATILTIGAEVRAIDCLSIAHQEYTAAAVLASHSLYTTWDRVNNDHGLLMFPVLHASRPEKPAKVTALDIPQP